MGSGLDFDGIVVGPAVRNLALCNDAAGRFNTDDGSDVSSDFNKEVGGETDVVTPEQPANTAGSKLAILQLVVLGGYLEAMQRQIADPAVKNQQVIIYLTLSSMMSRMMTTLLIFVIFFADFCDLDRGKPAGTHVVAKATVGGVNLTAVGYLTDTTTER